MNISNGNEFLEFTTHPNTSTVINTKGFVIFDETTKPTNVKADPFRVLEIEKKAALFEDGFDCFNASVLAQKFSLP